MRKIKFRIWNNTTKEIVNTYDANFITIYLSKDILSCYCSEIRYVNLKMMQYTGIEDIYGFEIYEGDIVNIDTGNAKIIFEDGCFWLKELDYQLNTPEYMMLQCCAEVVLNMELKIIGNIYENPELLNNKV